jgi:ribonuclease HI
MIKTYIDGLTEPINPNGICTYAFIVYNDGKKIYEECNVIGKGIGFSNNVAEYTALVNALKYLYLHFKDEDITIYTDSQLVANQISGRWQAHEGLYLNKFDEALKLSQMFNKLKVIWIPREQNQEADALSRQAYEEYCKRSGIPIRYHDFKYTVK